MNETPQSRPWLRALFWLTPVGAVVILIFGIVDLSEGRTVPGIYALVLGFLSLGAYRRMRQRAGATPSQGGPPGEVASSEQDTATPVWRSAMVIEGLAFFALCTVGCATIFILALLGRVQDARALGFLAALGTLVGAYALIRAIRTVRSWKSAAR
jgi:hypothetical protein